MTDRTMEVITKGLAVVVVTDPTLKDNENVQGSVSVSVSVTKLRRSELFNDILNSSDVSGPLFFPSQYSNVAQVYLDYVNGDETAMRRYFSTRVSDPHKGMIIDEQKQAAIVTLFQLAQFLLDQHFFDVLMKQLLNTWSMNDVVVKSCPSNVQQEIYLCCPLDVVPDSYRGNMAFLRRWTKQNNHKEIVLNGTTIYMSNVGFFIVNTVSNTVDYCYSGGNYLFCIESWCTDYSDSNQEPHKQKHGMHKTWYPPDVKAESEQQAKTQVYLRHDKPVGYQYRRYSLDTKVESKQQVRSQGYFRHNKPVGYHYAWYENGSVKKVEQYDNNGKIVSCQIDGQLGYVSSYGNSFEPSISPHY